MRREEALELQASQVVALLDDSHVHSLLVQKGAFKCPHNPQKLQYNTTSIVILPMRWASVIVNNSIPNISTF